MGSVWLLPLNLFIVFTVIYCLIESRFQLKENVQKFSLRSYWEEHMNPGEHKSLLASVLDQLFVFQHFAGFAVLYLMVKTGGYGSIFWFAGFSLLLAKPLGMLAAIAAFNRQAPNEPVALPSLYMAASERKAFPPSPWVVAGLTAAQALSFGLLLSPFYPLEGISFFWGDQLPRAIYLQAGFVGITLWLGFRFKAFKKYFSIAFILLIALFWLRSITALIPILKIVILDAFALNTFITENVGKGVPLALSAGFMAALAFAVFHSQDILQKDAAPALEHFVQKTWAIEIQHGLQLIVQVGLLLLLAAQRVAVGRQMFFDLFIGTFFGFNALHWAAKIFMMMRGMIAKRKAMWLLPGLLAVLSTAAFLLPGLRNWVWAGTPFMIQVLLTAQIAPVLYDSGLYKLLLEDYRDRYIWQVKPQYLLPSKAAGRADPEADR